MSSAPKRVGFVDYQLNNFHANTFLKILREDLKERGFEAAGCFSLDKEDGQAWSEENEVPFFESVEALNEHVDFYTVIAPSNPEVHLELCELVFPMAKATYVDKTFAPDLATAKQIFALADDHGVPMQTTSALRYTEVQEEVQEAGGRDAVLAMISWGGGRSFGEYGIHPTEMVVSCMGPEAETLMRRGGPDQSQMLVNFSGGRTAVINCYTNSSTPYAAAVTTAEATKYIAVDTSRIFINVMASALDLFETGEPRIDRQESLAIRSILDAAERPEAMEGFVAI